MRSDERQIQSGPQRAQAVFVDVNASAKKAPLQAKQNDSGIEELLAVYPRDDANDGVIKGV
jgi:hypothetical protein